MPAAYAARFVGQEALLRSHRGWDPGALLLANEMADALGAILFAATTTRLLADLNRSIGHRQLHSELTRDLTAAVRADILDRHYRPYRRTFEAAVADAIDTGGRVIHIASHSFTPVMDGVVRQADVAWLYDPRRAGEGALSGAWRNALQGLRPDLRLRRNYPYHGKDDGLTALLRKRHPADRYIGIELELNQGFVERGGPAWPALRRDVIASLEEALVAPR